MTSFQLFQRDQHLAFWKCYNPLNSRTVQAWFLCFVIVTLNRIFLLKITFSIFQGYSQGEFENNCLFETLKFSSVTNARKIKLRDEENSTHFDRFAFLFLAISRSSYDKNLNPRQKWPIEQLQSWELNSISSTFYFIFLN